MIEYNDKKGGKIKVANVTEARANFAEVLADTDVSYVVTKNNKPVRAIIDYEDFVFLRRSLQSQNSLENIEPNSADFQALGLPRPDRRQKSKSRVRGLLGSHQELLRHKSSFEESQEIDEKMPREEIIEAKMAVSESPAAAKNHLPPEEEDYFQTSDEDYLISPPEPAQQEKTEPPAQQPKFETPEPVPQAPVVKKSPEEQEYFNKYKKLYGSTLPEANSQGDLDRQIEERVEQLLKPKSHPSTNPPHMGTAQKFKPEPAQAAPTPKEVVKTQQKPAPSKSNLPSLKDLLKELDNEKLSIDEESVASDDEIDDLIHRITQD